ncbi:hypothetical protein FSP39_004752 [Pinctada imbricata]|uniref:VWFA domain-containing protein n=1 Tax=Pinctada imbricata TaxID=66713 RepID=A0AA88YC00_PINIB|nr:hypothetical protein FSP39_004752 [Pinctada imbricata]
MVDMGNSSYTMMSHSPEWWMIFCHRPFEPSNQRLYSMSSEMEVTGCDMTDSLRCNSRKADIVFLLDSSSSVWHDDFVKQTAFIQSVIETFEIGDNHIQVGVLTFTHDLHLNFHLNQYNGKDEMTKAVLAIQQIGPPAGTDTGKAIQFARSEMFKPENGGRLGVTKIIIVITDGYSLDANMTIRESHFAKEAGIKMFAIGVGFNMESSELVAIASQPEQEYVIKVDNYGGLKTIKDSLAAKTCQVETNDSPDPVVNDEPAPGKILKYCGGKPADIYFVIDESNSIWPPNFTKQLGFVSNVIDAFDVNQNHTRVGIVLFSDSEHVEIPLNNNLTKAELKTRVRQLKQRYGETNTGKAIAFLRNTGFSSVNSRPGVAHIAIVITDGQSMRPNVTKHEARLAHKEGIYIFAVGVGDISRDHDQELRSLASDPDDNFKFAVDDYDVLNQIRNILAIKTCQIKAPYVPILNDAQGKIRCPSKLTDIVFAYDSPGIGVRKSKMVRKSIARIVKHIKMTSTNTRIGVLSQYHLTDKDIKLNTTRSLLKTLRAPVQSGFSTLLQRIRLHSFSTSHGGRKNANKVAVVFLDKYIHNSKDISDNIRRVSLKYNTIVINVGRKTLSNSKELCKFTDKCINVKGYHAAVKMLPNVMEFVC